MPSPSAAVARRGPQGVSAIDGQVLSAIAMRVSNASEKKKIAHIKLEEHKVFLNFTVGTHPQNLRVLWGGGACVCVCVDRGAPQFFWESLLL